MYHSLFLFFFAHRTSHFSQTVFKSDVKLRMRWLRSEMEMDLGIVNMNGLLIHLFTRFLKFSRKVYKKAISFKLKVKQKKQKEKKVTRDLSLTGFGIVIR